MGQEGSAVSRMFLEWDSLIHQNNISKATWKPEEAHTHGWCQVTRTDDASFACWLLAEGEQMYMRQSRCVEGLQLGRQVWVLACFMWPVHLSGEGLGFQRLSRGVLWLLGTWKGNVMLVWIQNAWFDQCLETFNLGEWIYFLQVEFLWSPCKLNIIIKLSTLKTLK